MLLPYWTKGCIGSMDGIYFESSATLPHHWITAALVSAPGRAATEQLREYSGPTNPQRNLPYPNFDLPRGIANMRMSGTRYFIAVTDETKRVAESLPSDLTAVGFSGPYVIYRISGSELVTAATVEPVVVTGIGSSQSSGWLDVEMARVITPSTVPEVLVASGPKTWRRIRASVKHLPGVQMFGSGVSMDSVPHRSVPRVVISNIQQSNVDISFDVDRVGVPVIVHTSFHPNWSAKGAGDPVRMIPNFMVVVPTSGHVHLHYGYGRADQLGWTLTFIGVIALVLPVVIRLVRPGSRRRRAPVDCGTTPLEPAERLSTAVDNPGEE
jgi:hypothetical protein